jgi:hypothetical protein
LLILQKLHGGDALAELSQMGIPHVYKVIATQTTVTLASLAKYLGDVSLPRVVGVDANIALWSEMHSMGRTPDVFGRSADIAAAVFQRWVLPLLRQKLSVVLVVDGHPFQHRLFCQQPQSHAHGLGADRASLRRYLEQFKGSDPDLVTFFLKCHEGAERQMLEQDERISKLEETLSQRSGILLSRRTSRELEDRGDVFVRATTGFWSYGHFLSHAAFLCNADFTVLDRLRLPHYQEKKGALLPLHVVLTAMADSPRGRPPAVSALTGLYLYHRHSWLGETYDLLAFDFGITAGHVGQIITMWARAERLRFDAFGTLPTLEEEFHLRPLNAEFAEHVIVKPDWTGLKIQKPSDRWLQRLTWSDYYGTRLRPPSYSLPTSRVSAAANCFRIMLGCLGSGWRFAYPMMTGAVDEGQYLEQSNLLPDVAKMVETHLAHRGKAAEALLNLRQRHAFPELFVSFVLWSAML